MFSLSMPKLLSYNLKSKDWLVMKIEVLFTINELGETVSVLMKGLIL